MFVEISRESSVTWQMKGGYSQDVVLAQISVHEMALMVHSADIYDELEI